MESVLGPSYLIVKSPHLDAGAITDWQVAIENARGTVLATGSDIDVHLLETGTPHGALIIARFAIPGDLDVFWHGAAERASALPEAAQVLAAPGIPWEGQPGDDRPTIASVIIPRSELPRAYMLIEGSVTDHAKMGAYRDIIVPMLRERGAYYVIYQTAAAIRVLHGQWHFGALILSRWPDVPAAQDFWFSDRYQSVAIPTRQGAGIFEVRLVSGVAG